MKLRDIITEAVVVDNMFEVEKELISVKETILEQLIIEGVDDPGILKCVFMAGGPGSGKGYTSMEVFGIDKRFFQSFSATGLKVVNSDNAFEKELKKHGINPKELAKIEKNDPELWDLIQSKDSKSIRSIAKSITAQQKKFYEAGRLGMIIDGTGHDFSKVKKMKEHAENLGYDTHMLFVDTSLPVAKERNQNRDRVVPEDILVDSWKKVQDNLTKFKSLFGGSFTIIDNTVYKPIDKDIQKAINRFINAPIRNQLGKEWILTARMLKNAKAIK